jgi:hypothetical protein
MDGDVSIADLLASLDYPRWNSAGIVILAEVGNRRVLLPGDADARTWEEILARIGAEPIDCDIVVAWHHGGQLGRRGQEDYDGLIWSRVLKSGAKVAISHGGATQYGHPHEATIAAVLNARGTAYCTRLKYQPASTTFVRATAFPRARFGESLEGGGGAQPVIYRRVPQCCGDIRIDVETCVVTSSVLGSASELDSRHSNLACCLWKESDPSVL